jgi:hypothetical protein
MEIAERRIKAERRVRRKRQRPEMFMIWLRVLCCGVEGSLSIERRRLRFFVKEFYKLFFGFSFIVF